MSRLIWILVLATACTRGGAPDAGADAPPPDVPAIDGCDTDGATRCASGAFERCTAGRWQLEASCGAICDEALGCIDCRPEQRTCVDGDVRACTDRGTYGAVLEECAAESPCSGGYCGGCAADTDLVYLFDTSSHLFAFDPRTLALEDRGAIHCDGTTGSPYSMAVDRRGRAWVLYDDGQLFFVDIADATCARSGFSPDQQRFHTFGMGFSSRDAGAVETLFVAGGPDLESAETDTRLATIDTTTLVLRPIAPVTTLGAYYPELTGDGAGGLYGFFPSRDFPARVSTLRPDTGRIGPTWDTVTLDPGQSISAWAFARWGGSFFLAVSIVDALSGGLPMGSELYRLDPETGDVEFLRSDFHTFVGAGVSTCAPLVF